MRKTLGALVLLALPVVGAAPVEGALILEGTLALPAGAVVTTAPSALFVPEEAGLEVLDIEARLAHVHLHGEESAEARAEGQTPFLVALRAWHRQWNLTDAKFQLASRDGWVGVYEAGDATVVASAPHDVGARTAWVIGSAPTNPQSDPAPHQPWFSVRHDAPTLVHNATGVATLTGRIVLKLEGPDLAWTARENASRLETGAARAGDRPGFREDSWATLTLQDARVTLRTSRPFAMTSGTAHLAWEGPARIVVAEGNVEPRDDALALASGEALLEGRFTAVLDALEGDRARLQLQGDVASSSAFAPTAAPIAGVGVAWGAMLVFVGAALGVGGTMAWRRRRAPHLSPDEATHLADLAAEEGRFDVALDWILKARATAPASTRLRVDEAYFRERTGDLDGAMAAYEDAIAHGGAAEAAFLAASLAARRGDPGSTVARLLWHAFSADPASRTEFELDPAFDAVRRHPSVRAVLAEFA